MIEALQASKQGDGKKNRPQDFARLYEIIVQVGYDNQLHWSYVSYFGFRPTTHQDVRKASEKYRKIWESREIVGYQLMLGK